MTTPQSSERGSILVYILIAIVVFAAISIAMTNSGRESATTIDREKADLATTEILDYANAVRGSLQNMAIQGVKQNQVCFDSVVFSSASPYVYAACSTAQYKVFDPMGGNAPAPRQVSATLLDGAHSGMANFGYWYFPANIRVKGVGQDCDPSADCNEMIAVLAPIRKDVCINMNTKMGNPNPSTIPVNSTAVTFAPYVGSFTYDSIIDATELVGKRTGCFQNTDGTNVFYAVLIAH